jgi:hypothetical protein
MGGVGWALTEWAYGVWPCRSRTGFLHDYFHVSLEYVTDGSGHTIFSSTVKIVQENAWHVANPKIRKTLDLGPTRILGRSITIAALVRACKASILQESNLLHTRNRLCCINSGFLSCIPHLVQSLNRSELAVLFHLLSCADICCTFKALLHTPLVQFPASSSNSRLPGKKN